MSYTSRTTEHLKACSIAGSAIDASKRRRRLQRCRALLEQLDPARPPATAQAREFRWQVRALRERVHLYSEWLASVEDVESTVDYRLQKAEIAIQQSLRYFRDVLAFAQPLDREDDVESDV